MSSLLNKAMIAGLAVVFMVGCGQRQNNEHDHHAADAEHHHHDAEAGHHHHDDGSPLQLNNGEKWEADQHTVSLVGEMKEELAGFMEAGSDNYQALADTLTHQLSVLIAGCTMQGPAHDELHKWLVPVTAGVRDIAGAEDDAEANQAIAEIEENLQAFDTFFELEAN